MKRKALLTVANCTIKAFEGWASRGFLPFAKQERNWSDYSLENAIQLRLMVEAVKGTDVDSAAKMARDAFRKLGSLHPLYYTDKQELFVGLVRYDFPDAPEGVTDFRTIVAGRWQDLETEAASFVQSQSENSRVISIYAVSITKAAEYVWTEAREFGLPEGRSMPPVPEDLSGFPEWFKSIELARRDVVFGNEDQG